jgi:hypothetical protein
MVSMAAFCGTIRSRHTGQLGDASISDIIVVVVVVARDDNNDDVVEGCWYWDDDVVGASTTSDIDDATCKDDDGSFDDSDNKAIGQTDDVDALRGSMTGDIITFVEVSVGVRAATRPLLSLPTSLLELELGSLVLLINGDDKGD